MKTFFIIYYQLLKGYDLFVWRPFNDKSGYSAVLTVRISRSFRRAE